MIVFKSRFPNVILIYSYHSTKKGTFPPVERY